MPRFIRTNIAIDFSIASANVYEWELGVNPISHLLVFVKGANIANTDNPTPADSLTGFTAVNVLHNGATVFSASGADARIAGHMITGRHQAHFGLPGAGLNRRMTAILIPFGRRLFDPAEAFQRTQRGTLLLQLVLGTLSANMTAPLVTISQVELPDANPGSWVKTTTLSLAAPTVGDNDLDLPVGNKLLGATLFGTTVPSGTADTRSLNALRLLLDNVEHDLASSQWEDLLEMALARQELPAAYATLTMLENLAAAYTQRATSGAKANAAAAEWQYGYMDLDPNRDGIYAPDLSTIRRPTLRINSEDTTAIRVLPHELVAAVGGR